ncbi:MAG: GDP-mannose 4,6-dehydratase [Candidatus Acidiferrales bacterium]
MKVLITGAAGFIGGFLARHCAESGSAVLGIDVNEPEASWANAAFERCDVRDSARLTELLAAFRPDRIFHLAAQSYPTVSLSWPLETMDTNVGGTVSLFECVRDSGMMPIVVVACSSAEYGVVAATDLPVKETHALRPLHPYGVSKVAQDLLAAQYFANYSIPAIRIRIFKTTGPGKLGDVCSDLARRAIEIEMGKRPPTMAVGNLANRRSIVDVRDLVQALWLSVERCKPGEVYNLGGDDVYSVQELVEAIGEQVTFNFGVEQRTELMRPCDEPATAGDNTKFRSCCAWTPQIGLARTLHDMLEGWRVRFGNVAMAEPQVATARVARSAGQK